MGTVLVSKAACFYIRFPHDDFYRAIYVMERTVDELKTQVSKKAQVYVDSIVYELTGGRKAPVDDEFVRQLADGQDLTVEFSDHFDFDISIELVLKRKCHK